MAWFSEDSAQPILKIILKNYMKINLEISLYALMSWGFGVLGFWGFGV